MKTIEYSASCVLSERYVRDSVLPRVAKKTRPNERGCLAWIGARTSDGYAYLNVQEGPTVSKVIVSRLLLIYHHGPLAPGTDAEHGCDNPACVRIHPDHVRPLSRAANYARSRVHSPEVRAKRGRAISAALKGHTVSEATRAKIGAANRIALKGRPVSEATRAKLAARSLAHWAKRSKA